jgi:hypothetical protein
MHAPAVIPVYACDNGQLAEKGGHAMNTDTALTVATRFVILRKSLTVCGFINYDFAAEHFPAFGRSAPASPMAASGIARTLSMV